jgi:hypothetical protein
MRLFQGEDSEWFSARKKRLGDSAIFLYFLLFFRLEPLSCSYSLPFVFFLPCRVGAGTTNLIYPYLTRKLLAWEQPCRQQRLWYGRIQLPSPERSS